jgi:hypothetical protein
MAASSAAVSDRCFNSIGGWINITSRQALLKQNGQELKAERFPLHRRLMRSGVKAGLFEMPAHLGKGLSCGRRERIGVFLQQAIHIERAEADAFHMKRPDRTGKSLAIVEQRRPSLARRLLLDHCQQLLHAGRGGLAGIIGSGHSQLRNLLNFIPGINFIPDING